LEPGGEIGRADSGLPIYTQSPERFIEIGEDAGADEYIATIHTAIGPFVDGKDDKITKNRARKPADPSPWIGRSAYIRYMLISLECTDALTGWVQAGRPQVSQ